MQTILMNSAAVDSPVDLEQETTVSREEAVVAAAEEEVALQGTPRGLEEDHLATVDTQVITVSFSINLNNFN